MFLWVPTEVSLMQATGGLVVLVRSLPALKNKLHGVLARKVAMGITNVNLYSEEK